MIFCKFLFSLFLLPLGEKCSKTPQKEKKGSRSRVFLPGCFDVVFLGFVFDAPRLVALASLARCPLSLAVLAASLKNFDVSVSSTSLGLSRFRVFLSDGSSKTQQKSFAKKSCRKSKSFYKKCNQNPKPILSICFNHVFGRFSVRGVQKHHKKYKRINLTLVLFWPLTYPPTTGSLTLQAEKIEKGFY
jgi:hypothetical protein